MYVYFVLIIIWVVIYSLSLKLSIKQQKIFCAVLFGFTLFLVMGLRDRSVGVDIVRYLNAYNKNALLSNYKIEFGYQAYMTLATHLGLNDQEFLILTCLFISFSFALFFYKYSKNIFLSFYLHLTIGLFIVTLSALRQSIAICIILFSIDLIFRRKFLWFLIIVLLASTFHYSAVFFIPVYFCIKIKLLSYKRIIYLLVIVFGFFLLKNLFLSLFKVITPTNYIHNYGIYHAKIEINLLLVVIAILIPVFIVIMWKLTGENLRLISDQDSFLFIMTCINAVILILAINSHMIERISYYFITAYIVLIPNVISRLNLQFNKILIYGVLMLVCFVYFVLAAVGGILEIDNYRFFFL